LCVDDACQALKVSVAKLREKEALLREEDEKAAAEAAAEAAARAERGEVEGEGKGEEVAVEEVVEGEGSEGRWGEGA
jgi:hypothetical protein